MPLCWLGPAEAALSWTPGDGEAVPLVALEAPCLMRTIACDRLDDQGLSWRLAFISPSLGGLWAATAAGLGIALRTTIGLPRGIRPLDPIERGLPALPRLGLSLHHGYREVRPTADHLAAIIRQAVAEAMPQDWLVSG